MCDSVHGGGGGLPRCMLGYHHPSGTDTPQEQTPPQSRHPQEGTPTLPPDSVHRGASASVHAGIPPPGADTPRSKHPPCPPPQSMLGDTVNARAVRILLECNLVLKVFITARFLLLYLTIVNQICSSTHPILFKSRLFRKIKCTVTI